MSATEVEKLEELEKKMEETGAPSKAEKETQETTETSENAEEGEDGEVVEQEEEEEDGDYGLNYFEDDMGGDEDDYGFDDGDGGMLSRGACGCCGCANGAATLVEVVLPLIVFLSNRIDLLSKQVKCCTIRTLSKIKLKWQKSKHVQL